MYYIVKVGVKHCELSWNEMGEKRAPKLPSGSGSRRPTAAVRICDNSDDPGCEDALLQETTSCVLRFLGFQYLLVPLTSTFSMPF